MRYSPLAVANEFVRRSTRGVDHMKVQKLAYYAQGYALARQQELTNEQPQVWKLGPVYKSLYFELKYHGDNIIASPEPEDMFGAPPMIGRADRNAIAIIDEVWGRFKNHTAIQLSDLTHRTGTPWRDIVRRYNGLVPKDTIIPKEAMARYFRTHKE